MDDNIKIISSDESLLSHGGDMTIIGYTLKAIVDGKRMIILIDSDVLLL